MAANEDSARTDAIDVRMQRTSNGQSFESAVSSQTGLSSTRAGRTPPSSPPPGSLGSRFNPRVAPGDTSSGRQVEDGPLTGDAPVNGGRSKPTRSERVEAEKQMLAAGFKGGAAGGKLGAKAGSVLPGLGTGTGTAIGAAAGASTAQANTARRSGNPGRAFVTAMPLGGVVGGAVNAKLAKDVRTARQVEQAEANGEARPAQPDGVAAPARKSPVSQRIKDSKVGQAVQSESFRASAKRVGVEAAREAATAADRARATGSEAKSVATAAAKGAAAGAYRGARTEMANRSHAQAEPEATDEWLSDTTSRTRSTGRPISETYDYRFEGQDRQDADREYGA